MRITEVTENSVTFCGYGEPPVGPVAVPPEIADMAERRWRILLTAIRIGDEWRLLDVTNGQWM